MDNGPVGLPRSNLCSNTLLFCLIWISSHSDSAFTTDTPTPCNPPDILYAFDSNFPPACSSVRTTSAAERFSGSPGWRSVGIPLPSSVTVQLPSWWRITSMLLQCPARDSSTLLSTTSYTRWCNPSGPVDPMYIAGLFLTALSPLSTFISSAPYVSISSSFIFSSSFLSVFEVFALIFPFSVIRLINHLFMNLAEFSV